MDNSHNINKYRQEYYDKLSNEREKNIATRLRTSFIYAIAQAEEHFGFLWGHGSRGEKTDDQIVFLKKFQTFRKNVLDNGNNQIRLLEKDIGRNNNE